MSKPCNRHRGVLAETLESRLLLADFTVTNLHDDGPGSLRQAIIDANSSIGPDSIGFGRLFGTINLTSGELAITDDLTIFGVPGLGVLGGIKIQRDDSAPEFRIFSFSASHLTMTNLTVSGGKTTNELGGGLIVYGDSSTVTLDGVVFSGNTAWAGGAVSSAGEGNHLNIFNSTFSGNNASTSLGGAILVSGFLNMRNSTIANNNAPAGGGIGGASVSGQIESTTFWGNTASSEGGAIFLGTSLTRGTSGPFTIRNSTLSGNSANYGGAIELDSSLVGNLDVQNSTVSGNTAGSGGGGIRVLNCPACVLRLNNSAVSGNSNASAPDISSFAGINAIEAHYSAIGSNLGFTLASSSANNLSFGTNLLLGPLQNNGGPTLTMLPQSGSPLINAGWNGLVPLGLTTDQRGFPRIIGHSVDIGAVEYVIRGDLNFDGTVSIADFITLASNFNKSNTTYTDGDLNGDGMVSIADFVELASHFNQSLASSLPVAPLAASVGQNRLLSAKRSRPHHRSLRHHTRPVSPVLLFRHRD